MFHLYTAIMVAAVRAAYIPVAGAGFQGRYVGLKSVVG